MFLKRWVFGCISVSQTHLVINYFIIDHNFLAHLSTMCSRGAFRVVMCPSCVIRRASSVVRCVSSVVNNFFKHLLLPNRWANLDQTWQEYCIGGRLQKLFTEFDSIKNSGCHGKKLNFLSNSFKMFSSGTIGPILKIISLECSLGDPFQKMFAKF